MTIEESADQLIDSFFSPRSINSAQRHGIKQALQVERDDMRESIIQYLADTEPTIDFEQTKKEIRDLK